MRDVSKRKDFPFNMATTQPNMLPTHQKVQEHLTLWGLVGEGAEIGPLDYYTNHPN